MRVIQPRRVFVKLPYFESFTLLGSVAGYVDHTYSLTDIWDPNTTGTGHQPRGRDTWAALYNKYRIHGCKMTLTCSNVDIATLPTAALVVGSCLSDASTGAGGSTPILDLIEGPQPEGFHKVKWRTFNPQATGFAAELNRHSRRMYVPTRKTFRGISFDYWSAQLNQQDLWIDVGVSPASNIFFNVFMGGMNGDDTTGCGIVFFIKLVYYVEFAQPDFEAVN